MNKHLFCNTQDDSGKTTTQKVYFCGDYIKSDTEEEYEIGCFITRGGNGTIFCCYDSQRRKQAVKFMHRLDSQRLARFQFEKQVLSSLRHTYLLPCIDTGLARTTCKVDVPFLITELYRGNLDCEITTFGAFNIDRVKGVGKQICEAFQCVHSNGIVHRDVKPGNFFLRGNDIVVGDFGLAKTSTDEGVDRYYREDITVDGEMVGPINWMSPELIRYQKDKKVDVDHRSDIFQIGLVIWFMLTGNVQRGMLEKEDDPTGGRIFPIVYKSLQNNPDRRYQTVEELARDIANA